MIKANELRIGNLVIKRTETDCGYHTEYSKITPSIISSAVSDGEIDFIEPIPLTPEILEKAGFEKSEPPISDQWYNHKINWAYYSNSGSLFVGCDNENGYEIPVKIKSLHHLQNIHFDLYGEELEINL